MLPDTVQTLGVSDENVTVRPELAVALIERRDIGTHHLVQDQDYVSTRHDRA